jgi:succinyl-CoA synthetase beta subunit
MAHDLIEQALAQGRKTLNEYESKRFLADYDIPITREFLVNDRSEVARAVEDVGLPVAVKACSSRILHKTEAGLVRLGIDSVDEATAVFGDLWPAVADDPTGGVLISEMIDSPRELIMGFQRDAQFGPAVMFGLGGIFTEAIKDVVWRLAPLSTSDAREMIDEIQGRAILGPVRGLPAVDLDALSEMVVNLGRLGVENDPLQEIDLNPVLIKGDLPVVVDALILVGEA